MKWSLVLIIILLATALTCVFINLKSIAGNELLGEELTNGFVGNWQADNRADPYITLRFLPMDKGFVSKCKAYISYGRVETVEYLGTYKVVNQDTVYLDFNLSPISIGESNETTVKLTQMYLQAYFGNESSFFFHLNNPKNGIAQVGELAVSRLKSVR